MTTTTQTGIPIEPCDTCGRTHPVTRTHCPVCGSPSLYPHHVHGRVRSESGREGESS